MTIKDTNITRTIIADLIQTNMLAGLPHPIMPGTSLNQLLKVEETAQIAKGEYPIFGYYCIGDRGHTSSVVGDADDVIIDLFKHENTDMAPWRMRPFVMCPDGSDLPASERSKYALRTYEQWAGIWYWCYYLKRVDLSQLVAAVLQTTVVDGVESDKPLIFDETNLHPTRPNLPPDQATTASNKYNSISLPFSIEFSAIDAQYLMDAAAIYAGNKNRAIVSEIGFVGGINRVIQTQGDKGAQIQFNEAIGTQLLTHMTTYHQLSISTRGFTIDMELGANEPLNADDAGASLVAQSNALTRARTLNITSASTGSN